MLTLFFVSSGKPFIKGRPFVVSAFLLDEQDAFRISDRIKEIKLLTRWRNSYARITGHDVIHGKGAFLFMPLEERKEILHKLLSIIKKLEVTIAFSTISSEHPILPIDAEKIALREAIIRACFAIKRAKAHEVRVLLDKSQWLHENVWDNGIRHWIDDAIGEFVSSQGLLTLDPTHTDFTTVDDFGFLELANTITYVYRLSLYGLNIKEKFGRLDFPVKLYNNYIQDKIYSGSEYDDPSAGVFRL